MKKQNKKLITLLLAGALCCTAAVGVAKLQAVNSFAEETSSSDSTSKDVWYDLSNIFTSAALVREQENTILQLANKEEAGYRNAIALKWFDGTKNDAGAYTATYATIAFAFADANFKTITVSMDTVSSVASEAGKSTNKIKFTKINSTEDSVNVKISLIADGEEEVVICEAYSVKFKEELTLTFDETDCKYSDQFRAILKSGETVINTTPAFFKNIGANYASYSKTKDKDKEKNSLLFTAETEQDQKTQVYVYEINGQRFDGIKNNQVKDTQAPVLVVNEEVKGFLLGAPFAWSETESDNIVPEYKVIDVVKTSIASADKKIEYYQYNPNDESVAYKTLSTQYFMKTIYTKDKETNEKTSVYDEFGEEYLSIRFTLADTAFTGDTAAKFDLAWYADAAALRNPDAQSEQEYIVLNRTEEGPKFAIGSGANDVFVVADSESKTNKFVREDGSLGEYEGSKLEKFVEDYNALLAKKAEDIFAGSYAKMEFPTLEGLFYDDNGYRNLQFTICYKTKSSASSVGGTDKAFNELSLSASKAGVYEVKIFAKDKAENSMKFYLDGELVDVTSSNVWDIDAIPTFTYTVKSQGLKIQNEDTQTATSRTTLKKLGETYSFSGVTVVGGAQDQKSDYALYTINMNALTALGVKTTALTGVTYKEIREHIEKNGLLAKVGENKEGETKYTYSNYFALYLDVYATLLAEDVGVDKARIKAAFTKIEAYNDKITEDDEEWNTYNKYEFQKSSKTSFKVVNEGDVYIMFADYYDDLKPTFSRVSAYKIIRAEEKPDVNKGESQWLKDNLVSVILFSVAGVMLILIIVLLLIKPSDETLEDVDKKAEEKGEEKEEKKSEK